jgi:anti-sigma B factor antagonist
MAERPMHDQDDAMETFITGSANGWRIGGELDAGNVDRLINAVAPLPSMNGGQIQLDLGGVTFIDSSGLGALITLNNRVTSVGGSVVVRSASAPVRRLLAITKMDEVFGLKSINNHVPDRSH